MLADIHIQRVTLQYAADVPVPHRAEEYWDQKRFGWPGDLLLKYIR